MNSIATRSLARLGIAGATALTALALVTGPALADTDLGHHGKVGQHSLNEANGNVVCQYDLGTANITGLYVDAPNILARNTTAGVDSQEVGWRVLVRRKLEGSSTYTTVLKSTIVKTTATDQDAAPFKGRTFSLTGPSNASFKVVVKMFWYRPDHTISAWAKHRVDSYTEDNSSTSLYPFTSCNVRFGI